MLHQDQGVVQPPKRQKLETNASSEATGKWSIGNGCKRWQLVGGGLEFCKGIDVKLSGFHGVSNVGEPQFSRFRNSLADFYIFLP